MYRYQELGSTNKVKYGWGKGLRLLVRGGGAQSRGHIIVNNYSPKWKRIAVDIYSASKRRGKYPPLFTDTEMNNCVNIYQTSE